MIFIKHSIPNSRLHKCTWNILQDGPYAGEQDGLDKFKKIETISTNFSDHDAEIRNKLQEKYKKQKHMAAKQYATEQPMDYWRNQREN